MVLVIGLPLNKTRKPLGPLSKRTVSLRTSPSFISGGTTTTNKSALNFVDRFSSPMNELIALILPSSSNAAKMIAATEHHSCLEGNLSALDRAKRVQQNSSGQFPTFLKQLLKSHLSGKFYLGLPKKFCDAHMPSHDGTIVLVDENEQEHNMKYSVRKNRLSCGWRGFSVAHKLLEGDALIFHLIEPCKFRVYIMRSGKLAENEESIGVQTYDFPNAKPIRAVKMEDQMEECTHRTYVNSLDVDTHHATKRPRIISQAENKLDKYQSGNGINHFGCSVQEATRYSEPVVYFKDVNCFEDFKIQSDGLILDSEIPTNLRTKYYNLCCSQKKFLHDCLIKGLSSKLAVAVICEITNIADSITYADIATSMHSFECWDKTLKAFEDLGMTVGFLRDRVQALVGLKREYQTIIIETSEVEALEWNNKKLGFEFQLLARAPW